MLCGNVFGLKGRGRMFAASGWVVAVAWHAPLKTNDATYIACHVRCGRIVVQLGVEEMLK